MTTAGLLSKQRAKQFELSQRILAAALNERQVSRIRAARQAGLPEARLVALGKVILRPTQEDAADLIRLAEQFQIPIPLRPPYRKYHNQPVTVDGIRFDSKAEAAYYARLKDAERLGVVRHIEVHPLFVFALWGPGSGEFSGHIVGSRVHLTKSDKALGLIEITSFKPDFAFEEQRPSHRESWPPEWTRRVVDVKISPTVTEGFRLRCALLRVWFGLEVEIENVDRNHQIPSPKPTAI